MSVSADLLTTSILGPWVRAAGSKERRQQVYLTLGHWFEAAKFMPHKPDLRDALLFSPTLKEARKFSRAREDLWRKDWALTRPSVLIAGLGLLALQRPEMELATCDIEDIRAGLAPMKLPERFVSACLERFDAWRGGTRVAVFGADTAPEQIVGARMAKLVSPLPTWTLVTPCHSRAAWRVHDWALVHYVPVQYVGGCTARQSRRLAEEIVAAASQVIVFEQRRNKRFDHVLQTARALKRKVSLELYDPQDAPTAQMSIA